MLKTSLDNLDYSNTSQTNPSFAAASSRFNFRQILSPQMEEAEDGSSDQMEEENFEQT